MANMCFLNICSSQLPINYLPPLEVLDPYLLFLISGWQISFKYLSESWIPLGTYVCTKFIFSSINLSSVNLISRPVFKKRKRKKLEGSKGKRLQDKGQFLRLQIRSNTMGSNNIVEMIHLFCGQFHTCFYRKQNKWAN